MYYYTDINNLRNTINDYGFAVIPSVLQHSECDSFYNGVWDSFEHLSQKWEKPINRNDKSSWREIFKLYPMHSMLYQHWGLGHSQAIWDLRQNDKILNIYSKFWNCENKDLITSFDGLSFHLPPEDTNRGWFRKTWFHTDQSYTNNDFSHLQSWVTAFDVSHNDATLCVISGSHKYHKDFAKEFNIKKKDDWYKLNEEELNFYLNKNLKEERISCPKGSMVFWDSRTLHCGVEPLKKERQKPNIRCIAYLCYKPRTFATQKQLEKKQSAFEELRMTTHDPIKSKLFGKNPQTYGGEIPRVSELPPPILTNKILNLTGY